MLDKSASEGAASVSGTPFWVKNFRETKRITLEFFTVREAHEREETNGREKKKGSRTKTDKTSLWIPAACRGRTSSLPEVSCKIRNNVGARARTRGNARITYPVHAPWNSSYLPLETRISVSVTHLSRFQSPTLGTNLAPGSWLPFRK